MLTIQDRNKLAEKLKEDEWGIDFLERYPEYKAMGFQTSSQVRALYNCGGF